MNPEFVWALSYYSRGWCTAQTENRRLFLRKKEEEETVVLKNTCLFCESHLNVNAYADVNLVTALVPSETACLASSPGSERRTAVWTSREESVIFLL